MLMNWRRQAGLSLVELMVGLLVGSFVAAAGVSIYTNSIRAGTDNVKLARLNQDLRAMMDIMVRDIRRAGFVTSVPDFNSAAVQANPFLDSATVGATTDIAVYDYDGGATNCIVYAYNRNDDSPVVLSNDERLGFRFNTTDGELEMRTNGTTNEVCGGTWQSITEPEIEITGLTFTLTDTPLNVTSMMTDADNDGVKDGDDDDSGTCDSGEVCNTCISGEACLHVRNVVISLSGQLRDDATVTQAIVEQVRIRNDKYLASEP